MAQVSSLRLPTTELRSVEFALPANKVGVPVPAVLHDAPLARVVNVDQTKTLAIALRPLEVVQQGPDAVALHGYAPLANLGQRLDMHPQVIDALLVVNAVGAIPVIFKGGSIFGDNQRLQTVLAVNACENIGEASGENLPAHLRVRGALDTLDGLVAVGMERLLRRRRILRIILHKHARVVVDTQKVEGRRNDAQVALFDGRRLDPQVAEQPLWIGAAKDRIEEPAIA